MTLFESIALETALIAIGSIWGSFLGVLADRIPKGESILFPGSHCNSCQRPLTALDLVPFKAWMINKGRCAYCSAKIDQQTLLSELGTALLFSFLPIFFPDMKRILLLLIFFSFAFPLTLVDIRFHRLPHKLTWSASIIGILFAWTSNVSSPFSSAVLPSILGFLAGFVPLWLLSSLYPQGMGMGDAFWLGAIGTFVGPMGVLQTLLLSSFIATIGSILFFLVHRTKHKDLSLRTMNVPFGPFLSAAGIVVLLWQPILNKWGETLSHTLF
ncbi:MAG: prepilin peptidase [Leptospirales bacterium]